MVKEGVEGAQVIGFEGEGESGYAPAQLPASSARIRPSFDLGTHS